MLSIRKALSADSGEKKEKARDFMYRKDTEEWLKHLDFIILDMLCLQAAFVLAFALSGYGFYPYKIMLYRNMAIFLEMSDLLVCISTMKDIMRQDIYEEFKATLRHAVMVGALAILYLFLLQLGQRYSRLALILTVVIYLFLTYLVREIWKAVRRKQLEKTGTSSLLVTTTSDLAEEVVERLQAYDYARYFITGLAIIDRDWTGRTIHGLKVVANKDTAPDYVCQEWIDEALVVPSEYTPYPKKLIDQLSETGVVVHLNLTNVQKTVGKKQLVEKVGDYTVLTTSINYASSFELMLKRLMDISGGLVGCFLTGIIFVFAAPAIYRASPGPIFFSQERVGKNGKKFKMYKFRSMYLDAEARKEALMKENKYKDGKMFKLDFDLRVIGNEILPDGTRKTGIGDFLRRTSLDEFPQFYNVLKGDMSIVGTRPPLVSETSLYELHHHARLAVKPGITGKWQISGRSDITDFEEVVRLDREYIENWNLGMDIKILLKTVWVVLKKSGAV